MLQPCTANQGWTDMLSNQTKIQPWYFEEHICSSSFSSDIVETQYFVSIVAHVCPEPRTSVYTDTDPGWSSTLFKGGCQFNAQSVHIHLSPPPHHKFHHVCPICYIYPHPPPSISLDKAGNARLLFVAFAHTSRGLGQCLTHGLRFNIKSAKCFFVLNEEIEIAVDIEIIF